MDYPIGWHTVALGWHTQMRRVHRPWFAPAQDHLNLTLYQSGAATKCQSSKGMATGSNGQKAQHFNPRSRFDISSSEGWV